MSLQKQIAVRYPALTSRDFFFFWVGQFISLIGTWMQTTAQPYLAYRLSGQPFDLGLIAFAGTLPTFILALPGGVIVERLNKRNIVIAMQVIMMLQAFAMAALALLGVIQIWQIVLLSLVLGSASTIEITARQAMLVELVGKDSLPNAIALQSTIFNAARVIGPSLVAPFLIFIQSGGEGWAFFANGASYLAIIVSLFFVNTPFKTAGVKTGRNWLAEFSEGQAYIRKTRSIAMIILMAAVSGFIGYPLFQEIPVIASVVLARIGDTDAIRAARNSGLYTVQGVGALIAALTLASYTFKRKGRLLFFGQIALVSGLIAVAFSRSMTIEVIIFILLGWGSVTLGAMNNIIIQLEVPDHLRGRVFSTYLWGLQGVAPFGSLLVGWMAQVWGVPNTALVCGLVSLVVIGVIQFITPEIRNSNA